MVSKVHRLAFKLGFFFEELGKNCLFLKRLVHLWATNKINPVLTAKQVVNNLVHSFWVVGFTGASVGCILLIQLYLMLSNYQAVHLIGGLNTASFIRNVGPLMTVLLLAGKIGAFTAAELGNMRTTDQIFALECMGEDALCYLVAPRWLGIIFATIFLYIIAVGFSILGGLLMADWVAGVNELEYLSTIARFASFWDVIAGGIKSFFFSVIVATVSCYYGFYAAGGAQGVGLAVTKAAVYINLHLILSNYVLSEILTLVSLWFENY
jgi:phospholipid/cholesterol/gamma-HCH transport system permease protein